MSPRRLSDDERALWRGVTRAIAPLRKLAPAEPQPDETVSTIRPASPRPKPVPLGIAPKPAAKPVAPPPARLGRRDRKRIARGRRAIDGRLDLHGMTQAEAHDALLGFLRTAQARGARLVLIITGKGAGGEFGGRGVLKRMVPLWLGLPELRGLVSGFESAGIGHGGEGALYVTVRKAL